MPSVLIHLPSLATRRYVADTLSGEISSGVAQTLASKPIRRGEIVLGKWLAYWMMAAAYLCLTAGGVLVTAWAVSGFVSGKPGFVLPGAARGLPLMMLEATVMLTISIAGGTRFSTVTNGWLRCSSSCLRSAARNDPRPCPARPMRYVLFASTAAQSAWRTPAWAANHSTARSAHSATSFVASRNSSSWSRSSLDAAATRLL